MQYIIIVLIVFLFSACSYSPIVIQNKKLYIGVFTGSEKKEKNCIYYKINGFGIKTGLSSLGIGYFDSKYLEVDKNKRGHCKTEMAIINIE